VFKLELPVEEWGREEGIDETHLRERIQRAVDEMMAAKAANLGPDLMRYIEKSLLIQTLDAVWKEHLYALDHLRQGIGLRAYGQRDPLNEYKSEAFTLFNALLDEFKERITTLLARVEIAPDGQLAQQQPVSVRMVESHEEPVSALSGGGAADGGGVRTLAGAQVINRTPAVDPGDQSTWAATPRNAACPCGSGKKYKHCHGRLA
jgi:preprotein translocase subunit SecA